MRRFRRVVRRTVVTLSLALLAPAAPAYAGDVLVVNGDRVSRVDDPYVPSGDTPGEPAPDCRRRGRSVEPPSARTAGGPSVRRVLRQAMLGRSISKEQHQAWRRTYDNARRLRGRLGGGRRAELGSVIRTLERIAARRSLSVSRMPALFLQLQRNVEFWRSKPFPSPGPVSPSPCELRQVRKSAPIRITFGDSPVLFQYYPGNGLQLQPLINFVKANALINACYGILIDIKPGTPCRPDQVRRMLDDLIAIASRRGDSVTWEYWFFFGGGAPPWASGMAQGTAVQALARGAQLLSDPKYLTVAKDGLGLFKQGPPTGIRVRADDGSHYLLYSFAPGLRVLNGFLQSVIGLYDYAKISGDPEGQALFEEGDRAARAAIPRFDTGAWSLYSQNGRESDLTYHRLVRDFMRRLCERTATPVYCGNAEQFTRYLKEHPKVELLGAGRARARRPTRVRFRLSKVSCVAILVKRSGKVAYFNRTNYGRGSRSFYWTPRAGGRYSVKLEAVDYLNHHTVERGAVRVRRR
jgi:hypothetical protein